MADIDTTVTKDSATASGVVKADAAAIFDFLRRPANHAALSGDGTVQGTVKGPEVLGPGDRFGMKMKLGVPYRITSKVLEFEDGKRIGWAHFGGHMWRWELEPAGEGATKVTETFDMTTSKMTPVLRLMGYPKRHGANVTGSISKLQAHFGG